MSRYHLVCLIVLSLVLSALLCLPACSGNNEVSSPPAQTTTKATLSQTTAASPTIKAEAKPTGTLTMAVPLVGSYPDISPFSQGWTSERTYFAYMADYLIYKNPTGEGYVPGLAKSWTVSPDGLTVTFTLRQGVQFHNGYGELTASDVKWTLETQLDPKLSKYATIRSFVGQLVSSIEAPSPYEVVFHLKKSRSDTLLTWLQPSGLIGIPIFSKAYWDAVGPDKARSAPVYSGPYKFVEYQLGDHLTLEAVPNHWRVAPEFQTLIFKQVPELATRVAMMEKGEADIAEIDTTQAQYLKSKGFGVVDIPKSQYLYIVLSGQWLPSVATYKADLPWQDIRVRQAMNMAIDRQAIAKNLYGGYASPTAQVCPFPWGDTNLTAIPYDVAKAKQLLAEAGYKDGFQAEIFQINWPGFIGQGDLLQAVAGYWESAGIHTKITTRDLTSVYGDIMQRKVNSIFCFFGRNYGAPYGVTYQQCTSSKESTFPIYESADLDKLVSSMVAANTEDEYNQALIQTVKNVSDQSAMVPIVASDALLATSTKITVKPASIMYFNLEYATHNPALGTFRLSGIAP
jgi:peptide/nickel transport system substrate-binding protein